MCWRITVLLALCWALAGEQLALKVFSTAEGLPDNSVNRIVKDRAGFLWFCTSEGLSRFDGYSFAKFGTERGLPDPEVNDLLVAHNGYWAATRKGLCRLPLRSAGSRPTTYLPGSTRAAQFIAALAEDAEGRIWCGTLDGVYRVTEKAGGEVGFEPLAIETNLFHPRSSQILPRQSGDLWIANPTGLFRRRPDGSVRRYTTADGLPSNEVNALLGDRTGRLWVGTSRGLSLFSVSGSSREPEAGRIYTSADGLPGNLVSALLETSDGRIWVATANGLAELVEKDGKIQFFAYRASSGLPHSDIRALAEDRAGNLWVSTNGGGVAKIAYTGFVSFTDADGLHGLHVNALFETRSGELCVVTNPEGGAPWLHVLDGRKFRAVNPKFPPGVTYQSWGWNQHVLLDHEGGWWLPGSAGAIRFARPQRIEELARAVPQAMYGLKAGLPGDELFRAFEDSRGDVWLSMIRPGHDIPLSVWRRNTGRIAQFPEAIGTVSAFREDLAGNLWVGFLYGKLARYRDGRFTYFGEPEGWRGGTITDLYLDPAGRLWVATIRNGLVRIEHPEAGRPSFTALTKAQGLASDSIKCITADRAGRIYAGTVKGVDRLDPKTGHVLHYTTADGLAPGEPMAAFRDRHGALWFGTVRGLSRLIPQPDRSHEPSPVFITGVEAGGTALPASALGETLFRGPRLRADQNQLEIQFTGLKFDAGENLLYQFTLEGADRGWGAPTDQRSVRYARLAQGNYRFLVRAINSEGTLSGPAVVEFSVAPFIWRRWWFQSAVLIACLSAGYALHRVRVERKVALERIRTRLATDLHDDIGSSLTRIGVLSELAARQLAAKQEQEAGAAMGRVAALSRELGEAMSDIVWSVNPARDRLEELTQRIRQYAGEALEDSGIEFRFVAPESGVDRTLEPQVRRQVFLILKEAVNNITRHSGCTAASIEFRVAGHSLFVRVHDNGRGFDAEKTTAGNGLRSMRRRARELGGDFNVMSSPVNGTEIKVRVPLTLGGRRTGVPV